MGSYRHPLTLFRTPECRAEATATRHQRTSDDQGCYTSTPKPHTSRARETHTQDTWSYLLYMNMFIGRMRKPATDHACARRKPMGACSPSATTRAAQRAQPLHGMPPGDPRACAQATAPPPPPPPRVHVPRLLPQHLSDADAATHARAKTRGVTRHGAVATGTLDPDAQLALLTVNLLAGVSYLSPAHGITMHRWSRKTVATPIHLPNPNPAQTMVARNARYRTYAKTGSTTP